MNTLRRIVSLVAFALGGLARRRGKSVAVGLALALVTSAFASVILLTDALRAEAHHEMSAMPDVTVSRLHGGRPALVHAADASGLQRLDGVASVRPRVWGYLFVEGLESNLVIVGVPEGRVADLVQPILRGDAPARGSRGWVVLGEGVLRTLGARAGDGIGLGPPGGQPVDLTVAGSFRTESALTTADVALMDERDARTVLGFAPDEATDFAVALANLDESSVVARKVREAMPDVRVVERRSLARAYDLTYGTRGGLLAFALIPALIALIVLAWDRATGLSAEERREVAVLKAVGWSTQDVIAARLGEAVVISVAAGALGAIVAYAYVFAAHAPGLLDALLGWSSLYPHFTLAPSTDGSSVIAIAALTVLPYLAAAVVPAWRAAVLDPADALRGG
jgi:ABC-type lipoprotein release transport system permease subunit